MQRNTDNSSPVSGTGVRETYSRYLGSKLVALSRIFGGQVERRSHGALVFDESDTPYVNCSGYGVFLLGATNPHVVAAVVEQVQRHPLSARLFIEGRVAQAAEALVDIAPPGLSKVYFTCSGAEATETALKLARIHGFRRVVTMTNGYHGRTIGALSVSARPVYQKPFTPLLADVEVVPFDDVEALRAALRAGPPACVILEPIQGEAGVIIPSPGFLDGVQAACTEFGAFLVVDEILTGMGRVGKSWAIEGTSVRPDVLLVGKTLSGGVIPVAAVVATEHAYAPFEKDPFLHQSTFSGAPVTAAAALAAIEALSIYNVVDEAARIGKRLLESFRAAARFAPEGVVREIRGAGLLIGIEFADGGYAGEMVLGLVENGVIVNHSINCPTVIRFTPPAVITDSEITQIERAVERSFASLTPATFQLDNGQV
ncbi:aspartate aminotransferase family protein [Nocardia sp. NPDC057668]|uniref:aspartate aminotransferase family protein n=1 Tax=Nocardia sp. NPDC057668 TaxID=3346202 RepID=UPI00366CB6F8